MDFELWTQMQILFETKEQVAVVTLNYPEKLNALSDEMLEALRETFERIRQMNELRCVILTGAEDKSFSVGTDIGELAKLNIEEARRISEREERVCHLIENCGVPVIAAVNGIAAGGGVSLALACHLRVASNDAEFSLPEANLGLFPAYGGTHRLARIIGLGRANELMITNKKIKADEALRIGLVNRVVDITELINEAETLANEILKLAPLAVRACLQAVLRSFDLPMDIGLKLEAKLFSELFATEDMREGTTAFLEKRKPVFQGK